MRLLYPSDPFVKRQPDETFQEEYEAARSADIPCSLYSVEDFEIGDFKPRPGIAEGEPVLYRGWMLTPDAYARLHAAVESKGGVMITSVEQYRRCHYLPEWYPLCAGFTPETVFLSKDADFASALADKEWPGYFVKDYVKSLTTSRGSVAQTVDEIPEIVALIEKYRGEIEGGVCVRRLEDLLPETEERYFVFRGTPFGREGTVPEIVQRIAERIDSPFFSVDVVLSRDGTPRLIELGDGQVSDRKKWPAERFVSLLREETPLS